MACRTESNTWGSSTTIRGVPLGSVSRLLVPSREPVGMQHVFLCVADHFEPYWENASPELARERMQRWKTGYPRSVEGIVDSLGRPPQHTFFYPAEEYDPSILDQLADLRCQGYGDVEVHLHHDNDTSAGLREKLARFLEQLHGRHGLLHKGADGRIGYAFIHGDWALDNARPDGRLCGVNDELTILRETGCYADFTLPCAPAPGQTRMVNSIYYAIDDPLLPKSHDWGTPARRGVAGPPDSLLMIQGPLAWNWRNRKWGIVPRLENGDLHGRNGPSWQRFRLWLGAGVGVLGQPQWTFIKLHTHGAQEINTSLLLDGSMRHFHQQLAAYAQAHPNFRYYYVTAREMAALVQQAERGDAVPSLGAALSASKDTEALTTAKGCNR
jgi:hypothetical protein